MLYRPSTSNSRLQCMVALCHTPPGPIHRMARATGSPGNSGLRVSISAKMQPILHTSTAGPYCSAPSSNSGGLQQHSTASHACHGPNKCRQHPQTHNLYDANIRFSLCVHTHMYPTSDCHNFGWWMDWLDALSVSTHTQLVCRLDGLCCWPQLQRTVLSSVPQSPSAFGGVGQQEQWKWLQPSVMNLKSEGVLHAPVPQGDHPVGQFAILVAVPVARQTKVCNFQAALPASTQRHSTARHHTAQQNTTAQQSWC
jgi:hypothetical protein